MRRLIVGIVALALLLPVYAGADNPEKTVISLPDLSGLNLKIIDIPNTYQLKKGKSGYENHEKIAVDKVYYEGDEGKLTIDSALSLYDTANQAACGFEEAKQGLRKERDGNLVENAASFGQQSVLFVEHYVDPKTGDFDLFHELFYIGNVFVEMKVGGPQGEIFQRHIEEYAKIVEQQLKKDCPKCIQAELCSQ